MLEGSGGNIAASVGDDGIVIVDDQFAPLADKIRAALKGITDPAAAVHHQHALSLRSHGRQPAAARRDHHRARQRPQAPRDVKRPRQRRLDEDGAAREPEGSTAGHHVPARRDAARERRRHPRAACAERPHRRRQHRVLPEVERRALRRRLRALRLSVHRHQRRRQQQGHDRGARKRDGAAAGGRQSDPRPRRACDARGRAQLRERC